MRSDITVNHDVAPPPRETFEDAYPLSPVQEGLLFHSLYAPESGAYVSQISVRIESREAAAFVDAWRTVMARHPALRTAYVWKQTEHPLQVVVRRLDMPLVREDWRALQVGEVERRLAAYLAADAQRGFNPAKPPLMRLALVALAGGASLMIWTFHHLLLDGWSIGLVLRELLALVRDPAAPLPPAPRPYKDFIAWLGRQEAGKAAAHWQRELAGFTAPTTLAFDRGRLAVAGDAAQESMLGEISRRRDLRLSATTTGRLQGAARRQRVTLSTLQQGAWALLLSRAGSDRDVVFGSVVAGRPHDLPGAEEIVGLFVNTLPVRVRLPAEENVHGWLRRLQDGQLAARAHQHTPLAQIQAASEVAPGLPLFETLCAFENHPLDASLAVFGSGGDGGGAGRPRFLDRAHYPLTFVAFPGDEILLTLEHSARFEPLDVDRMLGQLAIALEAITAADRPLSEIVLASAAERHQLLCEWNDTAVELAAGRGVHQLIAEQAARTPDAVAVAAGDGALSYGGLAARWSRVAAWLAAQGVSAETPVGLHVERSAELASGLLGILAAGGVYLPLDPALPAARLGLLLDEARPAALLVSRHLLPRLAHRGIPTLCLEDLGPATGSPETRAARTEPQQLAYTVFTSGSTGRPKGVSIAHRSLVNFAREAERAFGLRPGDRILQLSPLGFNVVLEELVPTWLSGACTVLAAGADQLSCADLDRLIAEREITGLELPAPFWQEWVDQLDAAGAAPPACLRFLILGCERPHPERVAAWRRFAIPLVCVFGLTETTITSTLSVDAPRGGWAAAEPTAGRPIGNTQIYVLDVDLAPALHGVPGELWIGGEGVGRGYLGRPDLTAERYLPDPFGGEAGARLYRTGDLALLLPDGNLRLLGRLDRQVKVRGFRIEPGEIEEALGAHPRVESAVVVARRDCGRVRLVGYVVPARGAGGPADGLEAELAAHLAARLPAWMVPGDLVILERLPLTATGKIDRQALPAPPARPLEAPLRAAGSPLEAALLEIWADVLGVHRLSVDDDFFAAGGDSILSLQIVARAHRAGIRITPRQLFEHPTVAALAAVATLAATGAAGADAGDREPAGGEVPLTPIQRWFFALAPPSPQHWNLPLTLAARCALDTRALRRALAAVAAHHDALRLRFVAEAAGWRQTGGGGEAMPFQEMDLAVLPEAGQAMAMAAGLRQLQPSLDLERGPLARAVLFRRGAGGSGDRLALVVHHLVVDSVSWRILVEDLETAYGQLAQGLPVRLPAKTTSFQAWAERLASDAAKTTAGELPYWLAETAGDLALSTAGDPREDTIGASSTLSVALGAEATQQLLRRVPAVYRTEITDVLLAALGRSLAAWTDGRPFLVDLEGHGREPAGEGIDLSRTVGWFTALYPVRLDPAAAAEPGRALRAVKEKLRRVPGHGLGYGLLRYLAGSAAQAETLAARPAAPVLFNYLGQTDALLGAASTFALAEDGAGEKDEPIAAVDPAAPRSHRLEINAWIRGSRLHAAWTFSERRDRREAVEALARRFLAELETLIAHCLSPQAGGYTPADFPLLDLGTDLGIDALDRLAGGDRNIEDIYPLAPLQEGMVFHGRLEPERGAYFAQLVLDLVGGVDTAALRRAWQAVVDRHASLRVSFAWEGLAQPLQIVHRQVAVPWREEDWRSLAGDRERRFADLLRDDRERGLPLDRAPLLRFALLRLADDRRRLVWSYHQSLFDGWSLPIIFRDLAAFYRAFARGEAVRLGAAGRYRDFIAWLREQDTAAAEAAWRRELAGLAAPTSLAGFELSPPASGGETHAARSLQLAPAASAALQELGRRRRLTLSTIVHGAWALLLSRYAGEDEVLFGTTVAGRPPELPAVGAAVGLFINTLPTRVEVPPGAPLGTWLQQLQERQVEMRQHEATPLVEIRSWSEIPARSPLFESILVFENFPMEAALGGDGDGGTGFAVEPVATLSRTNYPLSLVADANPHLRLKLTYDARRFAATTMARVLSHLENLLAGFAAEPDGRLGDRSLLGEAERGQLLREWNDTSTEAAAGCLHERFAARAAERPAALAVDDGTARLTFAELDRWSDRLAHRLRRLGVGPEVVVGVCLERSAAAVGAILAVLKAGGAYLPLDPAHPAERLARLAAAAGAGVVLTGGAPLAGLPEATAALCLEALCGELAAELAETIETTTPLHGGAEPDNLCYVIHTSGSTGEPKGVMVTHRSAVNLLDALERAIYSRHPHALSVGLNAPLTFDSSIKQLFQLACGRAVHLLSEEVRHDPRALHADLARRRPAALDCTPGQLALWLEEGALAGEAAPELMLIGGEAIDEPTWERLAASGRPAFYNVYGPAECTVDATACRIAPPGPSLGRPLANVRVHVLDGDLQPLPIGALGELCVAGCGLARGYLGRPEETAARFVPDPFAAQPGSRLYRTGDRGRHLADGSLESRGRLDRQVKIRGARLEPGEVEAALLRSPAIRQALVVARPQGPAAAAETMLCAYVVPRAAGALDARALRQELRDRLPPWAIPGAFVALERIPLNAHGKPDLGALPHPDSLAADRGVGHGAPRTPFEAELAAIWREVLGREVGIDDDFFELGGHSLVATRLISRVRAHFEVDLPLGSIFTNPTVAQLAVAVAELHIARTADDELDSILAEVEALSEEEARTAYEDSTV